MRTDLIRRLLLAASLLLAAPAAAQNANPSPIDLRNPPTTATLGAAPSSAHYVTTQAESGLSAETVTGTGVATWLATPSSANLAAALTDETGSGAAVFGTAPQISTIELGAASDTTLARAAAGRATVEGLGVVRGPASSTDTAIPKFNGTTGDLIANSGVLINSSDQIILPNGTFSAPPLAFASDPTTGWYRNASSQWTFVVTGATNAVTIVGTAGITLGSTAYYGWTASNSAAAPDAILKRRAAANVSQGDADAASPVAQTSSVQNVVAGTSNTAGADRTIAGSQGTGTGAGGATVFKTAPAGTTGTAQNALATAFSVQQYGPQLPAAVTVANLPTCGAGTAGVMRPVSDLLAPALFATATGGGAVYGVVVCNATNWVAF